MHDQWSSTDAITIITTGSWKQFARRFVWKKARQRQFGKVAIFYKACQSSLLPKKKVQRHILFLVVFATYFVYTYMYIMFLYLYTVHLLQILEKKPERRFCFSRNLSDTDEGRFFWGCSYLYLYLYILFLSYTFIYIFSPEICLIPAEDAFSQAALIISNQKTRISQLFKCGLSGLFHVFYF